MGWWPIGMVLLLASGEGMAQQPPPPPIIDCNPGPYMVFFAANRAELDPEARQVLGFVQEVDRSGSGPLALTVVGHADTGERRGVDRERAKAVRGWLRRRLGVPGALKTATAGTREPRESAGSVQNRRVEIVARGIADGQSE